MATSSNARAATQDAKPVTAQLQCITCTGKLTAFNGQCTCPNDQYGSIRGTNLECSDCGSRCSVCTSHFNAFNGQCICTNGRFLSIVDVTRFQCLNCDLSCKNCSGPAATQCKTCTGNLTALNGQCTCQIGQYESSSTNFQCSDCDSTCSTCNGPSASNCLTCPSGSLPTNGFCRPKTCPMGCSKCSLTQGCTACRTEPSTDVIEQYA